ncbi:hypothetical protein FHR99_003075 [Litorivivens lipolytica]|uniref:Capsule assembly protein Wzi n=1 Tax=Litorivivens lipolytica TaxID=1524264 RepID=A0A7W4W7A9_9GAMM|nr:hypothetical protein [Litorivivens lipolytica]
MPVNTWPLMWSGVISEVNRVKSKPLSPSQRRSVEYIQQVFDKESVSNLSLGYSYAEQMNPIRGFGDTRRDEVQGYLAGEVMGERWAGKLQVNNIGDPLDGEHTHYDGSYLTGLLGNWAFTVGAIDRWWGPGWESGLILSNSARPVPGISLQRNSSEPFEWDWLRWIGPWQFTAFAGKLESDRVIPDAKLLGARFSFRPLRWLELGLSRTAQWGGGDRPQDFSSFKDLLLGKDNRGSSGISEENEPGNQLGGLDFRVSINTAIPIGFYGEFIGEDEAGGVPSRYIYTAGIDTVIPVGDSSLRIIFESSDTAANRMSGTARFNYAYEHGIYKSGYRYRNRPLGAGVDNDSRAQHLALNWLLDSRQDVRIRLSQFDLNTDQAGSQVYTNGNAVAVGESHDYAAILNYTYRAPSWRASLGYEHYSGDLRLRGVDAGDDVVSVSMEYAW